MACSSRNPQNCIAGANDYRTVDIPFPDVGEKMTGDAWLGWYTTKNGGLTWRTRLLPGFPQDSSAGRPGSPLKGYPRRRRSDHPTGHERPVLLRRPGLRSRRGRGSAIFVARFIDNNNQEGTAGEPIAYLGASIVHRIGARAQPSRAARRRGERRPRRESRDAKERGQRRSGNRACAPASSRPAGRADGRQAVDGRRHSARRSARCARSAAATLVFRFRRFPAAASTWRTRSSMAPAKNVAGSCSATPSDCATNVESAAGHQPSPKRRRQRRRRRQHRRT